MRLIVLKTLFRYRDSEKVYACICWNEGKANWKAFRIEIYSFAKANRLLSIVYDKTSTCTLYIFNSFLLWTSRLGITRIKLKHFSFIVCAENIKWSCIINNNTRKYFNKITVMDYTMVVWNIKVISHNKQ